MPTSAEIRRLFLDYFQRQGHTLVASSSLVPAEDPTLLFTNAGMVQFKDCFLGREERPYSRAASSQRCVRAGGKHNDLENVGYTARHHTFFEMLGNFSFGDYFKREAIAYAWELLTREFGLPPERLWVTVYKDDAEAERIWLEELRVSPERFSRCDEKDNFWAMGETGPCGPCTEIFYDHGPGVAGGPPGSSEADGDRYVEIWNLVFMQYERAVDGSLTPLPRPSVDTGMGLERIAAVLQGVHSNYDIDLFRHLIGAVRELAGGGALEQASLQVIADHIRSCAFLVLDGVLPSNEGRGYVLRRIIRRAIRHGHKLGLDEPFFWRLVPALEQVMGEAYPELQREGARVAQVLRAEEEKFAETLEQGMRHLEHSFAQASGGVIPGSAVFQLYDTYGFPVDLTADVARERGLKVDLAGFEREMQAQRERARAASHFSMDMGRLELPPESEHTAFLGYEGLNARARVLGLFVEGRAVERLRAGEAGLVVLDRTPFYAESGGQVGDVGTLKGVNGVFEVVDTRKQGGAFLHFGSLRLGELALAEAVDCAVAPTAREPTRRNHSATHLLHAALRKVLGTHVQQKGSLVAPDRLRFDFAHHAAVEPAQLRAIEDMVNAEVRANHAVSTRVMPMAEAIEAGALAFFGDKYGAEVRVLAMGGFSVELCGGTHVERTGDIGLFKVVAESGVAAGVRRIEAVTGAGALAWVQEMESRMQRVASLLGSPRELVVDKLEQAVERLKGQDKELQALKSKLAARAGGDLGAQAVEVGGVKVLAARLDGVDAGALRDSCDRLKAQLGVAALVLAAVEDGKVRLVAGVSKEATDRLKAGELVNFVAQQVGGKGGGRPDMAQAGGTDPSRLDEALASVRGWVEERLAR